MMRASSGRAMRIVIAFMSAPLCLVLPPQGEGVAATGGGRTATPRAVAFRPPAGMLQAMSNDRVVQGSARCRSRRRCWRSCRAAQAAKPKKEPPAALAAERRRLDDRIARHGRAVVGLCVAATRPAGSATWSASRRRAIRPAPPARRRAAMVTHRPAEKIANVVSFVEGYPLKEGSEVALDIGGKKFELFTKDDGAWARTAELDRTIVAHPGARPRAPSSRARRRRAGRPPMSIRWPASPRRWR